MRLSEAFPSKYLNAADIKFPRTVTIIGVRQEEVGQTKDLKYVIYFQNEPKGLVLNKTVWTQIALCTNMEDTDGWNGKSVELFQDIVRNPQGQMVPGVRVRSANTTMAPTPQRPVTFPAQPNGAPQFAPPIQAPAPPWSPEAEPIPDPGQPMSAAQYAAYQQQQAAQKPPF